MSSRDTKDKAQHRKIKVQAEQGEHRRPPKVVTPVDQPPAVVATTIEAADAGKQRPIAARWTAKLVGGGWTVVPDFFLANYHKLRPAMTNIEALFVVHLVRFKWDESPPRPAYKTLSKCMRMTDTAVRGHARSLEAKGYLRRRKRMGAPNLFYLEPLFAKLEELMPLVAAEDEARKKAQRESEAWDAANPDDE